MQPEQRARLVETLPWLAEPEPAPAPPPRAVAPAGRPRRRGALALIGVLGVLAGGYAMRSSEPVVATTAAPEKAAPTVDPADEWAARAEITLTSVDRQLDVIARTEQAWSASQARRPGIAAPAPVVALQERGAVLERRRAALTSQLDGYRALSRTRADLQAAEERLDAVEDAVADASPTASPDDAAALAALQEQRDLQLRRLDAKRAELAGLEGDVERAARVPLPDDGEATTAVVAQVMDVIHGGPPAPSGRPQRPEVVTGGPAGEHRATGAHPRGPGDNAAGHRSPRAAGPGHRAPAPARRQYEPRQYEPRQHEPRRHGEWKSDAAGRSSASGRDDGRARSGTPTTAAEPRASAHPAPAWRPSPHPRRPPAADDHRTSHRPRGTGAHPRSAGEAIPARSGAGHATVTKRDHEHTERSRSKAEGKGSSRTGSRSEPGRSPGGSGCSDGSGAREAVAGANH